VRLIQAERQRFLDEDGYASLDQGSGRGEVIELARRDARDLQRFGANEVLDR
jgi:hypothetical protein